jgi:hypothetical protein
MYVKLFSRIFESSLWEEPLTVRFVFIALLALADPAGYVVGTDIALARRLNVSLDDFRRAIDRLMQPDPESNSKAEQGRRIVRSDGEQGYRIVNYLLYRNLKDPAQRRQYMRQYMACRRAACDSDVNPRKLLLTSVNFGKPKQNQNQKQKQSMYSNEHSTIKEKECSMYSNEHSTIKEKECTPTSPDVGGAADAVPAAKKKISSDILLDEWLAELAKDQAYAGIDVLTEYRKMAQWCTVNGAEKPTRPRFISWLNWRHVAGGSHLS